MPDRITAVHRQAQLALRAATLRDLLRLWPLYDMERIPQTWPAFEQALILLIQGRGRVSAGLAAAYYRAHRAAHGVPGSPPPIRATPTVDEITSGLEVVGVVEPARQLARARPLAQVETATLTKMAQATGMYVLDFGRDVVMHAVIDDARAIGFARQTSGQPCAFCGMLASRGPVYHTEESASFEAHRGCACVPVPQWSRDQAWPAGAHEFKTRWNAATRDLSGNDALNAFRRSLEGAA